MSVVENPAVALSLPDPATLASASGTAENSSSSGTDPDSSGGGVGGGCSNVSNPTQLQNRSTTATCCNTHGNQNPPSINYVSRMKTGSRLCHHSIATASPQKNIHRVHQASSSGGRNFGG